MAFIESGDGSGNLGNVNAGKGQFVTLYDSSGNELIKKPSEGSYLANILIRQSAASVANTLIWSLFNPSATVKVRVRSIRHVMLFDGTAAVATTRAYYWQRTATAAPSAGTTITPTKKRTTDANSVVDLRFLDTGLTIGALTQVASPFIKIAVPISGTGTRSMLTVPLHVMGERLISPIELVLNEGIGLYLNETTTIGVGIAGVVEWDESTS